MNLNTLLDETAARLPGKTAIVTASAAWTFASLRERALRAAAVFHARGVKKGDRVAVVLRNSPEFVVAYFAIARLGAAAVPINFLITKPEELRFMLDDCAAVGLVTQREFHKGLLQARRALPALRSVWSIDGPDPAEGLEDFNALVDGGDPSSLPQVELAPSDVAAVLYTSGTTGSPKGVLLSHANLLSNTDASIAVMRLSERDVCLTILPMFHTFAWTACVLVSLRLGCKNLVAGSIAPAAPWLRLMGRHGATIFAAVPPVYSVLAQSARGLKRLALRWWFFRKVRFCVSGAAPLKADTARAFETALGKLIIEGYGLTETSPVATINPPKARRLGSVGLPIPGVRVKIIRDDEAEAPPGEEGEICIRGPNVMLGYHNRPDATREAFTRDGWFKTGDVGVLDADGYLLLRDRKKDMIIVKGLKVFPAQVEAVLARHPDVEETAVIGIPDGSGDETIKAFVVLRKGSAADRASIVAYCREQFDAYKRPRDIELVESLPKNALQKVLKRELRRLELEKRR